MPKRGNVKTINISLLDNPETINTKYRYRVVDRQLSKRAHQTLAKHLEKWMEESDTNYKEFSLLCNFPFSSLYRAVRHKRGINLTSLLMMRKNGLDLNEMADEILNEIN